MKTKKFKYTKEQLINIITDMAQYAVNNYNPEDEETVLPGFEDLGFVIACFVAQNTPKGYDGVEGDWPITCLKLHQFMSDSKREKLVRKFVEEFN